MSVDVLPGPALGRAEQSSDRFRVPAGLTLWRLVIVASAVTGVGLAVARYDVWWTALSQLSSIAVAVGYAAFAAYPHVTSRPEPDSPWLRGALATLMVLVAGAYLVMTGGDLSAAYSIFEHLLTPALVVADFLVVGANQHAVRWWHPLTWLLPPAAYLGWYVAVDLRVYVALDTAEPGAFAVETVALSAYVLATGGLFYAYGRRSQRTGAWRLRRVAPGG